MVFLSVLVTSFSLNSSEGVQCAAVLVVVSEGRFAPFSLAALHNGCHTHMQSIFRSSFFRVQYEYGLVVELCAVTFCTVCRRKIAGF